ncbi:MAG: hypothetical protein R6X02_31160 [Enhygromyxa sp.]
MSEAKDQPGKTTQAQDSGEAQVASGSGGERGGAEATGEATPTVPLIEQLASAFREQVRRALGIELSDEVGTTALAFVDHYLGSLRDETREPIISLVAANAGAWFGELVRREIGGFWIGDGVDPRRLRLLLEPQFVHFSPVDMAYEAILSGSVEPGDPRVPQGATLDSAYHLRKRSPAPFEHEPADHDWVLDRLAESPPVPEDQFYSLTGRFETLELILELLASREQARGREPTRYHLNDYVAALTDAQ